MSWEDLPDIPQEGKTLAELCGRAREIEKKCIESGSWTFNPPGVRGLLKAAGGRRANWLWVNTVIYAVAQPLSSSIISSYFSQFRLCSFSSASSLVWRVTVQCVGPLRLVFWTDWISTSWRTRIVFWRTEQSRWVFAREAWVDDGAKP